MEKGCCQIVCSFRCTLPVSTLVCGSAAAAARVARQTIWQQRVRRDLCSVSLVSRTSGVRAAAGDYRQ
jgi:hypothetical protein